MSTSGGSHDTCFNKRYIICWADLHRSKSTLGGGQLPLPLCKTVHLNDFNSNLNTI